MLGLRLINVRVKHARHEIRKTFSTGRVGSMSVEYSAGQYQRPRHSRCLIGRVCRTQKKHCPEGLINHPASCFTGRENNSLTTRIEDTADILQQ